MIDLDWKWLIGFIFAGPMVWQHTRLNRLEDGKADKEQVEDMRDDITYIRKRVDDLYDRTR
ncbi:MAG: hypothetical protein GEU78_07840 [Actinobacteria bacterium]|nr:hypothetical protein [Actinomycetota bacterium]